MTYLWIYASFATCTSLLLLWDVVRKNKILDEQHAALNLTQREYGKMAERYYALLNSIEGQKIRDTLRVHNPGQRSTSVDRAEQNANTRLS